MTLFNTDHAQTLLQITLTSLLFLALSCGQDDEGSGNSANGTSTDMSGSSLADMSESPAQDMKPGLTDQGSGILDMSTPLTDDGIKMDPDAAMRPDMSTAMPDMSTPPMPTSCAQRTAEIQAAAGNTITVRPAGDGLVESNGQKQSLRDVIRRANEGDTILLEDGTYTLSEAKKGSFTGLFFTKPNVTMRSASGDAEKVIIDSAYRLHGNSSATISVDAPGVTLANFTVKRSVFHLIHFWKDGDQAVVHDVRLVDGGQQFMKASPGDAHRVDDVEVSCSSFEMTDEGRDNVWGYGRADGNTTCYTGGIDTHDSRNWHVHDSRFDGIYCTDDGPARPVHGKAPDVRGGQTYKGGLSEHAIHMWDSEKGSKGHLIERNTIINCARGIGLGFRTEVHNSKIHNNMVFSAFPGGRGHDVGITVERAQNTEIHHNTVYFSDPKAYTNRIEYRWESTKGLSVKNNLTNGLIRSRNSAKADEEGNITEAKADWFTAADKGDLHLAGCDQNAAVGKGAKLKAPTDDINLEARQDRLDVGADHCSMNR